MRRKLIPVILLLITINCIAAGVALQAPEAKRLQANYESQMKDLRVQFEKQSKALSDKYAKDLKSSLDSETKKGNLDSAVQIRDEIKRVTEAGPADFAENDDRKKTQAMLLENIWSYEGDVYNEQVKQRLTFTSDGKVLRNDGKVNLPSWRYAILTADEVVLQYDRDWFSVIKIASDMKSYREGRAVFALDRIESGSSGKVIGK